MNHMISVIIPIHNVEDTLRICLNSVLKQTYSNFEIICIDDNSSDSSLEILEYFANKDSRVKILKNNFNRGLGYSRNIGLEKAKGDYVIFLNGKDWLNFNAFEILIDIARKNSLDILFFKDSIYYNDPFNVVINEFTNFDFKFENKIFNHFDLKKNELFEIEKNIYNKLFLKSFLHENNIKFTNENRINDEIPFLFKSIIYANKISLIKNNLYNYSNMNSLSNLNPERLFDCFDIVYLIIDIFLDNAQIYKFYKKELLNYIFLGLNETYNQIDKKFKERFYMEIQNVLKNFIKNYKLYEDILSYIDENILIFFKFDEIMSIINNPPKTSIIMPVYNNERDLPHVLDSIVNQTIGLENLEVIVIDDCSTDKSGEIIDIYSKKYKNIYPIHLYENSESPSKPRNMGIRNATSDYIMFHDSDDCFKLDACEILYETMQNEDVDFVSGMIMRNDNNKEIFELTYVPWKSILEHYDKFKKENIEKILESEDLFKLRINSIEENKFVLADNSLNSKLLKKSLFVENNIKYPEYLNGAEDSVVLFSCLIKSKTFVFVNKVVFSYNVHRADSLTHNFSLKTIQSRPEAYKLMYDIAISNNKKDLFIDFVLWYKLGYWIDEHLIKAPNLDSDDILSLFKKYQILFGECLLHSPLPVFLKEICEDVKNSYFEGAVLKIMEKRQHYFNL